MKKSIQHICLCIITCFIAGHTTAQVSTDRNFTSASIIKGPGAISQAQIDALDFNNKQESVVYFDGLGRPVQQIGIQASPSHKDIVVPREFDEFGRETKKFLPYADAVGNGSFKPTMYADQLGYYNTSVSSTEKDNFPVVQTFTEFSPLNRPVETGNAGATWQPGGGHTVQTAYSLNADADDVKQFKVTDLANDDASYAVVGDYAAGFLFKNITTDEAGNQVIEYVDQEGKIILKKVQIGTTPSTSYDGWLCTYYVYDDFNLLRLVIQPNAVKWLSLPEHNWTFDVAGQIETELCFRYQYDERHRMIAKQVPGAGWVYMVYDKRDRPVFIQDANMRGKGQWMYTLYDVMDRQVQTGMLSDASTMDALQAYVDGLADNTASTSASGSSPGSPIPADLTVAERVIGTPLYQATNSVTVSGFTSESNADFTIEVVNSNNTTFTTTQITSNFSIPNGDVLIPLTLTFYDDYQATQKQYNSSNNSKLTQGTNNYPDNQPLLSKNTGMVTSKRVRVIENPSDLTLGIWLETAVFYDEKGRQAQTIADNYKGGQDISSSLYDFTGKTICNYLVHNNPAANVANLSIKTNMDYDAAERLVTITKQLNDDATTTRIITRNTYDELGKLQNKQVGQKTATDQTAMENQVYNYTIRGWLKGINWDYSDAANPTPLPSLMQGSGGGWFAMDLGYDNGYAKNQYNGNIAGASWQSGGDWEDRKFDYDYDPANRLLSADFNQKFGSGWGKTEGNFNIDFSLKMGTGTNNGSAYDENGNIIFMQQKGLLLNTSSIIDQLSYTYYDNSNKLKNVIDGQNNVSTKLGDFRTSQIYMNLLGSVKTNAATDYTYDANGNLLKDLNKDIGNLTVDGIVYNHMNLPYQIAVSDPTATGSIKGTITYIYDANGVKLEKRVVENPSSTTPSTISTTTTYIGGFEYKNNSLEFFAHEEGRVRCTHMASLTAYNYDYFIKDHLGNVRTVLTDEQKTDIYPATTLEGDPSDNTSAVAKEENYYTINTNMTAGTGQGVISVNPSIPIEQLYNNSNVVGGNTVLNPGNPNPTAPSQKMYKLNGSNGGVTGLGITLKVMAGDAVTILGNSFWQSTDGQTIDNSNTLTNALGSFIAAFTETGVAAKNLGAEGATSLANSTSPTFGGLNDWLSNDVPTPPTGPKAYINWILMDEHFIPVANGSGFDAVGDANNVVPHNKLVNILKSGYLYVYCSNESNVDVYFDNLQVIHQHGPLVQDNAYSPWGIKLQGISSQAVYFGDGKTQKLGYNGKEMQDKEFSDGSGLNMYDYKHRFYDQQIGRFFCVDALADSFQYYSPYQFAGNQVPNAIDLDGLEQYRVITNNDGSQDVVLEVVNAPFSVMIGDQRVDNFPQQNERDWVSQNVVVNYKDGSNSTNIDNVVINSVTVHTETTDGNVTTVDGEASPSNPVPLHNFSMQTQLSVNTSQADNNIGAMAEQTNNLSSQMVGGARGVSPTNTNNSSFQTFNNQTNYLATFQSINAGPLTFSISPVTAAGTPGAAVATFTGSSAAGHPVPIQLNPTSNYVIQVTNSSGAPAQAGAVFNFSLNVDPCSP